MPFITAADGAQIFYKDWGTGRPVVLSHGWPLNADSWEAQQLFLAVGDPAKVDVPTLVIHGDDDQVVPLAVGGQASARLVDGAQLRTNPGAPHGITDTHKEQLSHDLLEFLKTV